MYKWLFCFTANATTLWITVISQVLCSQRLSYKVYFIATLAAFPNIVSDNLRNKAVYARPALIDKILMHNILQLKLWKDGQHTHLISYIQKYLLILLSDDTRTRPLLYMLFLKCSHQIYALQHTYLLVKRENVSSRQRYYIYTDQGAEKRQPFH